MGHGQQSDWWRKKERFGSDEKITTKIKLETEIKAMKNKSMILAAVAGAILATGCKPANDSNGSPVNDTNVPSTTESITEGVTNAWQKTKEATTNAWANTKQATAEAWSDVKESLGSAADYSYDKKDEFVTKAQADLDALDQKIQTMSDKTDAGLHDKRAALDQKLTDVKNATQDNWNATKTAFKDSYNDVKNSLKQYWNKSVNSGSVTN